VRAVKQLKKREISIYEFNFKILFLYYGHEYQPASMNPNYKKMDTKKPSLLLVKQNQNKKKLLLRLLNGPGV